jgi:RNA polymerase sigma factor (TIGR02999 family)
VGVRRFFGRDVIERNNVPACLDRFIGPDTGDATDPAWNKLLWPRFWIIFSWREMADRVSITGLLHDWISGEEAALGELAPYVYRELHMLAQAYLRRSRPNQTLQPTALINEVYLRLLDQKRCLRVENRSHFFGIAARLMRQVLVDYTRAHHAEKRGAGACAVTLDRATALASAAPDVLDVDEALNRLCEFDMRKGRIVEMRYFGGMTREEIASALGISLATVKRDLRLAEAWLRSYLQHRQ